MERTSHCERFARTAGRRWRPAPAIRLSAAFHLSGVAALAFDPAFWPYVGMALGANHAALAAAGMWPRSSLLGPNLQRLPPESVSRREIALTFDDGPHPAVTPRVLDLLDHYHAKATFFCVGIRAATHLDITQEIARRGHIVENHTQRHPGFFAAYGMRRLRREIEAAQETLQAICGRAPRFLRAPAGFRNPLLDPVLTDLELTYVSWTRRGFDTVDRDPRRVLQRLTHKLSAGDVLVLHDGSAARTRDGVPLVLSVLPPLLERLQTQRLTPVSLASACSGRAQ
ncbi:MAG TPA: polysaccharide deacetylase family protein [Burkholderiales bacterium]|nr:polysaccharide deacetylase family protein [Burkholderiales bacterium]